MARTKKMQAYHDRQTAAGRMLVQTYLDVELHERAKRLARLLDVPLAHVYGEALEDYIDKAERDAAAALSVTLQHESVRNAHAAAQVAS